MEAIQTRHPPDVADADASASGSPHTGPFLFVDATGVLASFGTPPTGIPRVERFLIDAAAAEPEGAVLCVCYDRRRRRFRELNAFERRQLHDGANLSGFEAGKSGVFTTIRRAFRFIRENPAISKDTDRHFGSLAAGNRGRGSAYIALKSLFRLYRLSRKLLAGPQLLWATGHARTIDPGAGTVLLSNTIVLGSSLARIMDATKSRAIICHDLIPVIRPELAIDAAHARRFAKNIAQILQSSPTVLCTSGATFAMMTDMVRSADSGAARIVRFPMPSILYEKADRTGRTSRIQAPEPFILYCSTIEARKNHLLLVQIWKQAIEDGVALPKLICAGKWGWGINVLFDYLASHKSLASHIEFIGPVTDDQLINFYRSALFGVVPSRIEGWGFCASECLDFGLPVIVSTDRALRESTAGMMPAIDADDRAGWYAEIRRMTEDGAYRAALCRRIAEQHRPTTTKSSWTGIKRALLERAAPVVEKQAT